MVLEEDGHNGSDSEAGSDEGHWGFLFLELDGLIRSFEFYSYFLGSLGKSYNTSILCSISTTIESRTLIILISDSQTFDA